MEMLLRTPIKDRKKIANIISLVIQGNSFKGIPFSLNDDADDECWTVDVGNNWHLKFFDENENKIKITYRYNSDRNNKVLPLINWLCELFDAVIVEK